MTFEKIYQETLDLVAKELDLGVNHLKIGLHYESCEDLLSDIVGEHYLQYVFDCEDEEAAQDMLDIVKERIVVYRENLQKLISMN